MKFKVCIAIEFQCIYMDCILSKKKEKRKRNILNKELSKYCIIVCSYNYLENLASRDQYILYIKNGEKRNHTTTKHIFTVLKATLVEVTLKEYCIKTI